MDLQMETLFPYVLDWINLLLRWLHVIVAIAWIGASFYFVWLDNSLHKPQDEALLKQGVTGELWAVHGGGFYNPQKYMLAPQKLPEQLHWFYWESYSTWLSGFALFSLMYLLHPETYLIDRKVLDMTPTTAALLALAFLVAGWVVYDLLCRFLGQRAGSERMLGLLVAGYVLAATWTACNLFAGRAAFLLVGAMMATIMSANVFFLIIPGQRKVIAAMKSGQTPDPIHGQQGKQRSVHNTYFTLPVLFAMLSNHYSMTYNHPYNWAVLFLIMLASVFIRQFFLLKHQGITNFFYPALGVVMLVVVAAWIAPSPSQVAPISNTPPSIAEVRPVVEKHCVTCHNAQLASKNIRLDSEQALQSHAPLIYQQVVVTRAMPLNNANGITEAERSLLGRWAQTSSRP